VEMMEKIGRSHQVVNEKIGENVNGMLEEMVKRKMELIKESEEIKLSKLFKLQMQKDRLFQLMKEIEEALMNGGSRINDSNAIELKRIKENVEGLIKKSNEFNTKLCCDDKVIFSVEKEIFLGIKSYGYLRSEEMEKPDFMERKCQICKKMPSVCLEEMIHTGKPKFQMPWCENCNTDQNGCKFGQDENKPSLCKKSGYWIFKDIYSCCGCFSPCTRKFTFHDLNLNDINAVCKLCNNNPNICSMEMYHSGTLVEKKGQTPAMDVIPWCNYCNTNQNNCKFGPFNEKWPSWCKNSGYWVSTKTESTRELGPWCNYCLTSQSQCRFGPNEETWPNWCKNQGYWINDHIYDCCNKSEPCQTRVKHHIIDNSN